MTDRLQTWQGEGPATGDPAARPGEVAYLPPPVSFSTPRPADHPYVVPPVLEPYHGPLTEDEMMGPHEMRKPCACGTEVVCWSTDIPAGVRAHQATPAHQRWRWEGGMER